MWILYVRKGWVYCVWHLSYLGFSELFGSVVWCVSFHYFWKTLCHVFWCFFCSLFFLLDSNCMYISMWDHLILSLSCWMLCSVLGYFVFPLFVLIWVISIDYLQDHWFFLSCGNSIVEPMKGILHHYYYVLNGYNCHLIISYSFHLWNTLSIHACCLSIFSTRSSSILIIVILNSLLDCFNIWVIFTFCFVDCLVSG